MITRRALMVTTVPVTLQAFLLPLADALRDKGWTVHALTGRSDDPVMMGEQGVLQAHFDEIFQIGWYRSLVSLARIGSLSREICELVALGDYEVVHVHTPIAAFITRFALKRMSVTDRPRIIYTVHGFHFLSDEHPTLAERLYHAGEVYATHFTDDLVVMNDVDYRAAGELVAHTHAGERPCTLHRIDGTGMDFAAFDRPRSAATERIAVRTHYGIPEDAFVVGMIAEMNENKRHRLLLLAADALVVLRREHTQPIHYLLMGTGPEREALMRKVDELGLLRTVHFTGQINADSIKAHINACDLGVLVSAREGLPRSLMEFVASKVPVIGTQTRGITDIVRDPDALCQPQSTAIAQLIARYADDADARSELAQVQYAYARARYDVSVVIPQYLTLYRSIRQVARAAVLQPVSSLFGARVRTPAANRVHAEPQSTHVPSQPDES